MIDVDKSLAKLVRSGVLKERLYEDQVVLLRQGAEVSYDRPVPTKFANTRLYCRPQLCTEGV